jgi:DNA helicase-2/ATP-dependent DNA helicase PcrA
MTIHRSKGLEWPVVHLIGFNDKIIPHAWAEDIHEERRLAYVAMTRARDVLRVSCIRFIARSSGKVTTLEPSPFLEEAGLSLPETPMTQEVA